MTKRALFAVAGFLSLCLSLSAQETQRPGPIQPVSLTLNPLGLSGLVDSRSALAQTDIALNNAYGVLPSLTLSDGGLFSFPSAFGWMEATPADFLPVFTAEEPRRFNSARSTPSRDSGNKAVDLLPKFDYASGEVGVFYGKSTGKFGREVKQGYILGEVGDDKFHFTVGAAYQDSSGRLPRLLGR
jgi:hypothetical protein